MDPYLIDFPLKTLKLVTRSISHCMHLYVRRPESFIQFLSLMWPGGILSWFAASEPHSHCNKTYKGLFFQNELRTKVPIICACALSCIDTFCHTVRCVTNISVDVIVLNVLWCETCTWNTTITICLIWIYSIYKVNVSHIQLWKLFLRDVK